MKERLKQLRAALGLSQAEMAARLGVQQQSYGRWENTGKINPSRVLLICQTFGVPRAWFERGEGTFEMNVNPPAPSVDSGSWQFMQRFAALPEEERKQFLATLRNLIL